MKKFTAIVYDHQYEFLEKIVHEDAANSIGGSKGELGNSVQWCIDACMKIEERHGVDACYVSMFGKFEDEEQDAFVDKHLKKIHRLFDDQLQKDIETHIRTWADGFQETGVEQLVSDINNLIESRRPKEAPHD